ncbi:hypothetical protein RI367_002226 [Sorochytrium milnesiophthora]
MQQQPPAIPVGVLSALKPARIFNDNTKRITSLAFDDTGAYCVVASEDDSIRIYDCNSASLVRTLYSKKYGVHLARFTHRSQNVLYASTKNSHDIRYLSTTDNKFISYFKGHTNSVVSLEMSPVDDMFISASVDGTVRLWDTRTPNCQGSLQVPKQNSTVVGIDPSGAVFAVATHDPNNPNVLPNISLYDIRNFEAGPFENQPIHDPTSSYSSATPPFMPPMTGLRFSNDGQKVMITTSGDTHYILNSFNPSQTLTKVGTGGNVASSYGSKLFGSEADITPDSSYVIAGTSSDGGTIVIYDISTPSSLTHEQLQSIPVPPSMGQQLSVLDYVAPTPISMVAFNPKFMMMASTSQASLAFWIPDTLNGMR